jgi:hypothetical protein
MSDKSNYLENKLTDAVLRAQPWVVGAVQLQWVATSGAPAVSPPTFYVGLLEVSPWANLSSVALDTYIIRPDVGGKQHLLKCTTAGLTSFQAPIAPSANDAVIQDGTVTWTDQYTALESGVLANIPAELLGGTYARQPIIAGLSTISGTQAAASTIASAGTNATVSNNNPIVFSSGSGGNGGAIGIFALFDALTGGNLLRYGFLLGGAISVPANSTLTFPAGSLSFQEDN